MLNHRPIHLDLAALDDLSLLQSLEAMPLAVAPEVSAVTSDDPLAGLHLEDFFDSAFSTANDIAETGADHRSDVANEDRLPVELENCGNTVSSTLPILIDDFRKNGRLKPGMRNMLIGFGVGWSWAGCVWKETWQ